MLYGLTVSSAFQNYGYSVMVSVDGSIGEAALSRRLWLSDILMSTLFSHYSPRELLVSFRLTNAGTSNRSVGVSVGADVMISEDDNATCSVLDGGLGINMTSGGWTFQWVLKNYTVVAPVDAFWFGRSDTLIQNRWSQVNVQAVESVDTAMAFSWQNRTIPPGGRSH
jgi:hypothetical protein